MQTGTDEGTAHTFARLRRRVAVIDDKVEQVAEVVVASPAVQLFPLVGAHEPEKLSFGMLLMPVFSNAPAPAGGGKLQIQLAYSRPG